jgi:D-lactate dehydrogenase (cytochrome)
VAACLIRARVPRGEPRLPGIARDPDVLASFVEDAAHFPGGHGAGIATIASEAEAAALLQSADAVLPIGAQSSLTGGATPMGEILLSTQRLNRILEIGRETVRVEAGVTLTELDAALDRAGRYYPPAPTFFGAFVGGTVATNAAGAATFKYGTTRDWIQSLTIVLPSGDVLDVERGATRAHRDGYFDIELANRSVRVPVPRYRMPDVPKLSAGYFARPDMDLIDLFIGCEGTLGVITEVTLRVLPERPAFCLAFVPFPDRAVSLAFVRRLRETAKSTWRTRDPHGIDVSAIEHMDARCLALLREDGIDRLHGVNVPADTAIALLVTLELPASTTSAQAFEEIGSARDPNAPDTALVRFCRALDDAGVLDRVEIAVPGDRARASHLLAVREAVPAAVNQRVGLAKQTIDPRIEKTAADMIVAFDALDALLERYDEGFARRGLDAAVWGHISDGNVHPNVIPRSFADVESGKAAILEFGREVMRLGGSPLAEHGVGRNAVKQQLLVELYGTAGVDDMRRVKRAIDPAWKLAPGVLFPRRA